MPNGVLDSIPPEQVMQCQSEEDCARVAKCLPSAEAALLDWAVNLMADVVQEEQINKMNTRNIAMVFAPNMTQVMHCARKLPIELTPHGNAEMVWHANYRIHISCRWRIL